ncbi:hypothetical protein [Pseudomonas sp. VE 196-7]|uniref:hypothetical protein n=1 Tax=Pseudomonas sp. VE 196-7 TaxID=2956726 RepID=UPI0021D4D4BB|nr:hypothetical protein [Pseudomonas sp. VE 196-7]MCU7218040.1 hypothetical protein [Pseudomonas sp. VE 196-7]
MNKQEATELKWKIEGLERQLKASNDLVIFLLASIAGAQPNLAQGLKEQFEEMRTGENLPLKPEFEKLLGRATDALGQGDFDLDGVE